METLARAHRRAHDLCGVGPTMGFVATGQAARTIEQVLLAALKADRALTADEVAHAARTASPCCAPRRPPKSQTASRQE